MARRAVLVGAGDAHLFTLKWAAAFIRRGLESVLVAPDDLQQTCSRNGCKPWKMKETM
jgi:hypothetical protein